MGFTFTHLVIVTAVVTASLQIGEIYLSKKPTPASTTRNSVRTARETGASTRDTVRTTREPASGDHCPANDPKTGCKCKLTCTSPTTEAPPTTKLVYRTRTPISHRSRPPTTAEIEAPPLGTISSTIRAQLTTSIAKIPGDTTTSTAVTTTPEATTSKVQTTRYTSTETDPPTTTTASPTTTTASPTTTTASPTTTTASPTTTTASPTTTTTSPTTTTTPALRGPRNCKDVFNNGETTSKVYSIYPDGRKAVRVFCEQALSGVGGGWTVFQSRINGSVNFNRTWANYRQGFGDPWAEHWLGNDALHLLTYNQNTRLLIELNKNGATARAQYSVFWIDSEPWRYKLHVGGYIGCSSYPGDALGIHDGMYFSAVDRTYPRSKNVGHCGDAPYVYPWWSCGYCNLNAPFGDYHYYWYKWTGHIHDMTTSRMMLKGK